MLHQDLIVVTVANIQCSMDSRNWRHCANSWFQEVSFHSKAHGSLCSEVEKRSTIHVVDFKLGRRNCSEVIVLGSYRDELLMEQNSVGRIEMTKNLNIPK